MYLHREVLPAGHRLQWWHVRKMELRSQAQNTSPASHHFSVSEKAVSEYPACLAVSSMPASAGISSDMTTPAGFPPWLLCENAAILRTFTKYPSPGVIIFELKY
jgi:hypothetical protein